MFGLISRDELKLQAGTYDAANLTPSLIRRLIAAEMQGPGEIYVRTDQGIRLGGWDGRTVTPTGGLYIPPGEAVWEISADENVKSKANDDFNKRTQKPGTVNPKLTTYIAVTLRSWSDKATWVAEKKATNQWLDVRAYDVDDIAAWLERWSSVAVWLAWKTGKASSGIVSVDQFEVETINGLKSGFPLDLLLVDRQEEMDSLVAWLSNTEPLKILKGDSRLESMMFLVSTLKPSSTPQTEQLLSKIVVVETNEALRALRTPVGSAIQPIIVINSDEVNVTNKDLVGYTKVLRCVDKRFPGTDETVLQLKQQNKTNLKQKLEDLKYPKVEATRLVDNSNGSFHTLLRLFGDVQTPNWASETNGTKLTALLLLGGWDVNNESDIKIVKKLLMGQDYLEFEKLCKAYSTQSDSPVKRTKNCWELVSRIDSWHLLSKYLTDTEVKAFKEIAIEVLSEIDPQFDIKPDERWYAGVRGKVISHSPSLREGISETLVLLALFGEKLDVLRDIRVQDFVSGIVRKILIPNWKNWASLHQNITLLAEASPSAFLDAAEESLEEQDGILEVLNQRSSGVFSGAGPIADIMWALETVCWYKEHLSRAVLCLGQMANADLGYTGNVVNGPLNTLSDTIGPFLPQTDAPLAERLDILKLITDRYPEVSWRLHEKLMPGSSTSISHNATPRFRDYIGVPEKYYRKDLRDFSNHACSIFLELTKQDVRFQPRLIDVMERIDTENQKTIIGFLVPPKDDLLMQLSWNEINKILTNKVRFPDAQWVIDDEIEELLKGKLSEFTPTSPTIRNKWLFDEHYPSIREKGEDYQAQQQKIEVMRLEALNEILQVAGIDSVLKFAAEVKFPFIVGRKLGDTLKDSDSKIFFMDWINEDWFFQFYSGLSLTYFYNRPIGDLKKTVATLNSSKQFKHISTIMTQQKFEPATWQLLSDINNQDVFESYWKGTGIFGEVSNEADAVYIIENLNKYGRAYDSAMVLHDLTERKANQAKISHPTFFRLLSESITSLIKLDLRGNAHTMSGYYLANLLTYAEDNKVAKMEEIAILEWKIHPLLEGHRGSLSAIKKWLVTEPTLFCEMVTLIYKDDEGKINDTLDPKLRESLASAAFNLLSKWKGFPGNLGGTFDPKSFSAWFSKAKELNKEKKHLKSGDYELGKVLSRAPSDNGLWPHKAVADYLEKVATKEERHHCFIEIFNNRGVVSKSIGEGGKQERELAETYLKYANQYRSTHPKVYRLLQSVSECYMADGKRADIDVERFD